MSEPFKTESTLDDAKALIEKTKAARNTCRETCDIVGFRVDIDVHQGHGPTIEEHDAFVSDMLEVLGKYIGPEWTFAPESQGFLRRCEKCRTTPLFPWADKLDPEKVLAYMAPRHAARCAFWLGELESTL